MQNASASVQPGLKCFMDCKTGSMKGSLDCYKAARLLLPHKVQEIQPSVSDVNSLCCFPFLSCKLDSLKRELPEYIAATEDITPKYEPLELWRHYKYTLISWAAEVRKILLVQPSPAESERVLYSQVVIW